MKEANEISNLAGSIAFMFCILILIISFSFGGLIGTYANNWIDGLAIFSKLLLAFWISVSVRRMTLKIMLFIRRDTKE